MGGAKVTLNGPLFWVLTGLLFLAGMTAAFVVIDVVRRAWFRGERPTERVRWFYLVPQALYLALMLLGEVRWVPILVTGIVVLSTPFAIAQQVAYLLRVVFPAPSSATFAEEDMVILADGGDTIEPESSPAREVEPSTSLDSDDGGSGSP